MVVDQRNELYGVRWLDGYQSGVRQFYDERIDCQYDLHAGVHRIRRIQNGSDDRCRLRCSADADALRVADVGCVRRDVDVDVVVEQRDELYGVGCMVGYESDVRYLDDECVDRQLELHAHV